MNIAVVGIGSNINPKENIEKILDILDEEQEIIKTAQVLKTEPIGITDQPPFLNTAVMVQTWLSRIEFIAYLKVLEDRLGRDRSLPKFGPRTIDLDLEVWNNRLTDDDYFTRDFLQKLLAELGYNFFLHNN